MDSLGRSMIVVNDGTCTFINNAHEGEEGKERERKKKNSTPTQNFPRNNKRELLCFLFIILLLTLYFISYATINNWILIIKVIKIQTMIMKNTNEKWTINETQNATSAALIDCWGMSMLISLIYFIFELVVQCNYS